jgi:TnpA family transposase
MPRRTILSEAEREGLRAVPSSLDELIRYYTFNDVDLALIRQRRKDYNRLGFAVQLCYLRYPGYGLPINEAGSVPLLLYVGEQLGIDVSCWSMYAQRQETRREHLQILRTYLGLSSFSLATFRETLHVLTDVALQIDKGIILARQALEYLRQRNVMMPPLRVIERLCGMAIAQSNRRIYQNLIEPLSAEHQQKLDALLTLKAESQITTMAWLYQSPAAPNIKNILVHIERLEVLQSIGLPNNLEQKIHQNRLLKMAREGRRMSVDNLAKFETNRRYATMVAILMETKATIIDEIIDLHDRIMGKLFNRAKRNHETQFQQSGKAINNKVRLYYLIGNALLEAKQTGTDPFAAIENVISWEDFTQSLSEAEKLAQAENFDYLPSINDSYPQIRRYSPILLKILQFRAVPAAKGILEAINILTRMQAEKLPKIPEDAPMDFVKKRWQNLVLTEKGIDKRFYEFCLLSELRNALRSGDIWVKGSRQFKDFNDYLLPPAEFLVLKQSDRLPLGLIQDCDQYLQDRFRLLDAQLQRVSHLAETTQLPDAIISTSGLKITPLDKVAPASASGLIQQVSSLLPRIKITELLLEVEAWTNFSRHFTHLKGGEVSLDKTLLLTVILADAINLGLMKMAQSCPEATYAKLSWHQAWFIRDDTYALAIAELVNAQLKQPLAQHWGDGTTSSSDGQRFPVGSQAKKGGNINPKYGSEPGIQFYTHISDQYSPFHTQVINVGVRDSTYVLDGLLYHESDLRIEEHYTDTAGFTDHVFALMHLFNFRFAPRIRDLADKRLFVPDKLTDYPALSTLIGGTINHQHIRAHWDDILRLITSIQQGTVTASLMIRKLSSYPRQNGLALALREIGRIERSLFMLDWFQNLDLRRRVHAGLNKGEARNALSRAVFFNRLGTMRDHNFAHHRYRASGLNLVTAAISLWNTVYLEKAIHTLRERGQFVDPNLLQYLSPLGWEHIGFTGDYIWQRNSQVTKD